MEYSKAELICEIAMVAKFKENFWKEFEIKSSNPYNSDQFRWYEPSTMVELFSAIEYGRVVRKKPETITVAGIEIDREAISDAKRIRNVFSHGGRVERHWVASVTEAFLKITRELE